MAIGIGETLRAARHEQGKTLADAAAETRVREAYLAALEEEQFEVLGGDVYVKGFLRSYARFLELDPEPLLEAYRREFEHRDDLTAAPLKQRPVAPMGRERQPGIAIVAAVAGALLLVLAAIGLLGGDEEPEQVGAPGPSPVDEESDEPEEGAEDGSEESPGTEAPAEGNGATADDGTANEPDGAGEPGGEDENADGDGAEEPEEYDGVEVELTVTGSVSWVRVTVDGQTVLEGERTSGFSQTFEADDEVALRIGDAAQVSLVVNGEDQGTLGSSGEVIDLNYSAEDTA